MPRQKMNPEKKKRTVSITLTPLQQLYLNWLIEQTDENQSIIVGNLIEREAKKIARQREQPLPTLSPAPAEPAAADIVVNRQAAQAQTDARVELRQMLNARTKVKRKQV